jgi:hypothetical protein
MGRRAGLLRVLTFASVTMRWRVGFSSVLRSRSDPATERISRSYCSELEFRSLLAEPEETRSICVLFKGDLLIAEIINFTRARN